MKPAPLKQTFACALLLPLLALIGFSLRNTPTQSPAPATTANIGVPPSTPVASHPATAATIQQLKREGSYDSLQQALQSARLQPEPVRNPPPDLVNATHTMATPWRGLRSYFGPDA